VSRVALGFLLGFGVVVLAAFLMFALATVLGAGWSILIVAVMLGLFVIAASRYERRRRPF
jgi:hypothetical protein